MASFNKSPITKFSRVKNDLAELQRWWPAYIKDDGVLGITIDPVLFKTQFGSKAPTSDDDESDFAGIRVEAINDDGTDVAGTEPTIVISGSGTFDPRCTINHADGTSTVIMLIAPTTSDTASVAINNTTAAGLSQTTVVSPEINQYEGGMSTRTGPYPVYMTVQELVELIDTYRHIGGLDVTKPAWLPHVTKPAAVSYPAFPTPINTDNRIPTDPVANAPLPTISPYRATVFMPMMLDNNQLADVAGSFTLYGAENNWNKDGISRYDTDPEGTDSATISYKRVGTSGDHQENLNYATSESGIRKAIYTSQDSSECPPPHYRMAMSLACFLKDGTYSLNNGVLIPYVYDATRAIGGTTTDTMYMRWDGKAGYGTTARYYDEMPAGVYPFFDFMQGPITPRAQGSNWTNAVLADHIQSENPLRYEVPPNVKRQTILSVEVLDWITGTVVGGDYQNTRTLRVVVNAPDTIGTTQQDPQAWGYPFIIGDSVYIEGLTGVLGIDSAATVANEKQWAARYSSRRRLSTDAGDCNGWWKISGRNQISATKTIEYRFTLRPDACPVTALYVPTGGTLCQGRVGGPEYKFNSQFCINLDGSVNEDSMESGMDATDLNDYIKLSPDAPDNKPPTGTQWPADRDLGTGFQAGMNQGDNNVPPASSSNDTYPARPTMGQVSFPDADGVHYPTRAIPRSISIQTLGTLVNGITPDISSGDGSLRIPTPLGKDLCTRYNNTSQVGAPINTFTNTRYSAWRVRSDIPKDARITMVDKWAWRGVSTPLWSYIDGNTGRHAWDYIKPPTWTYGRNRSWPAHERMGTRLSMSPSLLGQSKGQPSGFTGAGIETTKIGLSEIGCSPIYLDIEVGMFIPQRANRMSIIEFDAGDSDPILGRHHMIYGTDSYDAGFGFRPLWDGAQAGGVFERDSIYQAQTDSPASVDDIVVTIASTMKETVRNAIDVTIVAGGKAATTGGSVAFANFGVDNGKAYNPDVGGGITTPLPKGNTANRPAIWFAGGLTHWTEADKWTGAQAFVVPSTAGFGRMGTGFGQGPAFGYTEGFNTVRSTFTTGGMSLTFNGGLVGTDPSAQEPVWGFQIKSCGIFADVDRRPYWLAGTDKLLNEYSVIATEEPLSMGWLANSASPPAGVPFTASRLSVDRNKFGTFTGGAAAPYTASEMVDFYSQDFPYRVGARLDNQGRMLAPDNPALQISPVDLQIDQITLRQIPTPAMLPFTVDTVTQSAPTSIELARYTELIIEADNIKEDDRMKITVTLMEPPVSATIAQEASTPITGFENLNPDFISGTGAISLVGLPASALTNGFVIRFNFFVPDSTYPELHPIDWNKTPIIRSYSVFYDHKPTSDGTIIGNTYDGSTATTVGTTGTQTFTTKVGHIVSLRMIGDTTDPDRTITKLKADFGDGTITDWISVSTAAASVSYDISHVYSTKPAGGTYDIKVYSMDDVANVSDASDILRVTIVAGEPVAVLRAVPSMVRAGQAIRFDGSSSYSIDTAATIATYAWTFGDGSSGVSGSGVYQDHTYAIAGEFMATLIVTDSVGTVSPVGKAVVKVLPATLVVPLTLSTRPSKFSRTRSANLASTPILDAVYPEVSDMGTRGDQFTLSGMFLKETMDTDIAFMEELLLSGSLVEFEYQEVNYTGVADSKKFVGRMTSFDYNRQGGNIDRTPYSATFIREAGLGV